ncbi:hypothetical protein [Legionella qingyii]|nr:hypothetical protein [Legionella qingyii]
MAKLRNTCINKERAIAVDIFNAPDFCFEFALKSQYRSISVFL